MSKPEADTASARRGLLHLVFKLGDDRYAIRAAQAREVLALRKIKALPEEPAWLAGLIEQRGEVLPVVDLVQRATGRPAAHRMATRIVLVDSDGGPLGLLLERVSGTMVLDDEAFREPPIPPRPGEYLGAVARHGEALIQRIEVDALLPPDVRARLFDRHETAQ